MFSSSNTRLIIIAAIYVLHITLFDGLMDGGYSLPGSFFRSVSSHQHSQSNFPHDSSYRLLNKYDKTKEAKASLPDCLGFVAGTFAVLNEEVTEQLQFVAFPHLNISTFKLYRLFRVFLI